MPRAVWQSHQARGPSVSSRQGARRPPSLRRASCTSRWHGRECSTGAQPLCEGRHVAPPLPFTTACLTGTAQDSAKWLQRSSTPPCPGSWNVGITADHVLPNPQPPAHLAVLRPQAQTAKLLRRALRRRRRLPALLLIPRPRLLLLLLLLALSLLRLLQLAGVARLQLSRQLGRLVLRGVVEWFGG